nr:hypothetical protein [Tanacetum cinerariifolium]
MEKEIELGSIVDDDDDNEGNDDDDDAQEDDDYQKDGNKDDDDQEEGDDDDDQEGGSDNKQASDEEGKEFIHPSLSTHDDEETRYEESFDPIPKTPKNTNDEGNGEENLGLNVGREEGQDEDDDADELYRDVNINLEGRGVQMADVYTTQEFEDSHMTLTPVNPNGQQQSSSVPSQFVTSMLNSTPDAGIKSIFRQHPRWMFRLQPQLRDEAQAKNDEFLKTIKENTHKIIKEKVKEQVKVQVSKILSKIEQTMNEQLEVEVLTRSSNSSKSSYAVAADLSEMELKKILIEKMEGKKESAHDVYSKCRIIVVTELKIVEWQNYKHLDWIMVRRDDDKLYKFKEGNFKRLRIQDIEDMLLLLV